jgi:hypothetical protein
MPPLPSYRQCHLLHRSWDMCKGGRRTPQSNTPQRVEAGHSDRGGSHKLNAPPRPPRPPSTLTTLICWWAYLARGVGGCAHVCVCVGWGGGRRLGHIASNSHKHSQKPAQARAPPWAPPHLLKSERCDRAWRGVQGNLLAGTPRGLGLVLAAHPDGQLSSHEPNQKKHQAAWFQVQVRCVCHNNLTLQLHSTTGSCRIPQAPGFAPTTQRLWAMGSVLYVHKQPAMLPLVAGFACHRKKRMTGGGGGVQILNSMSSPCQRHRSNGEPLYHKQVLDSM